MFNNESNVFQCLKSVVIAVIFSLVAILIFALVLKFFALPNNLVKPINYLIKCLSVFIGCYFSVRGEKGALKGFIFGVLIMIVCFLLFSLLRLKFSFIINLIWEILLGGVTGAISGIFAVNKK